MNVLNTVPKISMPGVIIVRLVHSVNFTKLNGASYVFTGKFVKVKSRFLATNVLSIIINIKNVK